MPILAGTNAGLFLFAGEAALAEYLDHRQLRVPHDVYCSHCLKRIHVIFGLEISPAVNEEQRLMHR
jgi:hypothetical protein